jgi:hypothetical protein
MTLSRRHHCCVTMTSSLQEWKLKVDSIQDKGQLVFKQPARLYFYTDMFFPAWFTRTYSRTSSCQWDLEWSARRHWDCPEDLGGNYVLNTRHHTCIVTLPCIYPDPLSHLNIHRRSLCEREGRRYDLRCHTSTSSGSCSDDLVLKRRLRHAILLGLYWRV